MHSSSPPDLALSVNGKTRQIKIFLNELVHSDRETITSKPSLVATLLTCGDLIGGEFFFPSPFGLETDGPPSVQPGGLVVQPEVP